MAPPKAAPAREKKATALEMPSEIRRNFLPRTYSGDILSKWDKMTKVQQKMSKSKQLLIWDNRRGIIEFPELSLLDFKVEMKIMDIVFGEDPLMEGTTSQEYALKAAKLAAKNLENVLSIAGKKRLLLQERHNHIIDNMKIKIRNSVSDINTSVKNHIDEFLEIWEIQADQAKEHLNAMMNNNVAEISAEELKVSKRRLKGTIDASLEWINQFEKTMGELESNRSEKVIKLLKETGEQLKKLNFERSEAIEEMLKKEAEPWNEVLIKNRETIYQFVTSLTIIITEIQSVAQKYIKEADSSWSSKRFASVFSKFKAEVEVAMNTDFDGLYKEFQLKFDKLVDETTSMIEEIMKWNPANGLKNIIPIWRHDAETIIQYQDETISAFSLELESLEKQMDKDATGIYNYWLPIIKECKKEGSTDMKAAMKAMRKTNLINAGKQASLSLFSKAAKNNLLLQKVMEYITCIANTTTIYHQVQLLETELEISKEHKNINLEYSNSIEELENEFNVYLKDLKLENNESLITTKTLKAKEILETIRQKHIERIEKGLEHLKTFEDQAKVAHGVYKERIAKLFQDDRREKMEAALLEERQAAEGSQGNIINEPIPDPLENVDPNLWELRFWPMKVEEWRVDQIGLIEEMNRKLTIAAELEQALKESILNPKEPPPKKKGVNLAAEPPKPKPRYVKYEPELLDGTPLYAIKNPINIMEQLSLESEPYTGQFFEFNEQVDEVTDIKIVDGFLVKQFREFLQNRVDEDCEYIWQLTAKKIKKKMIFKIDSINRERAVRLAEIDTWHTSLDEVLNSRITQLPRIQIAHENEAKFLIDTIHSIRDNYSNSVESVFKDFDEFDTNVIKDITRQLPKCSTSQDLKKLFKRFTLEVERFNFDTSDALERAGLDFDHGRKMLEKSKQPGNHSSAWALIKEYGAYDPATIGTDLENWKKVIAEDISRAQKEILTEIKMAQKEFDYHQIDFDLEEKKRAKIKSLKMLLIGERIQSRSNLDKLDLKIKKYSADKEDEEKSWMFCLDLISQAVDIETFALEIAQYLSISKNGKQYSCNTLYTPSKSSWDSWKTKYHVESKKTPQLSKRDGVLRPLSGTSFTLSRKPSARGRSRTFRLSSNTAVENNLKKVAESSESSDLKPLSLDSNNALSKSQSILGAVSESGPLLTQMGSGSGSSALAGEAGLTTEVTDVAPPQRPYSAGTATTTTTPKARVPKSASKSSQKLGKNVSSDNIPSTTKREIGIDFLPPLPLKDIDFQAQILNHESKKKGKNVDDLFKTWITCTRAELIECCDKYLSSNKDREIRRKDLIPENHTQCVARIDQELNEFSSLCDEFKIRHITDFSESLNEFGTGLEKTIQIAFKSVKEFTLGKMAKIWSETIVEFLDVRKKIHAEKKECLEQLKTNLGHPTMHTELDQLLAKTMGTNQRMLQLIDQLKTKMLKRFERLCLDFVGRITFLSILLADIASNWVEKLANASSTEAVTPPSTAKLTESIDFSLIPFSYVQHVFKDVQLANPAPSFKKVHIITFVRSNVLITVSDKFISMIYSIGDNCASELAVEQRWMQSWTERVNRIKSSF